MGYAKIWSIRAAYTHCFSPYKMYITVIPPETKLSWEGNNPAFPPEANVLIITGARLMT